MSRKDAGTSAAPRPRVSRGVAWTVWVWMVACGGQVDPPPVDTGDVAVELAISPEDPHAMVDALRCASAGPVSWAVDDVPWTGALETTNTPGDTVPADVLEPGQVWVCEAPEGSVSVTIRRPSVVLVVADDLGYGDVGTYGHPTLTTPGLDRLAEEGVRFTAGYVSAPSCSPSRAGMLTGRQQNRFGFEYNIGVEQSEAARQRRGLPPEEQTLGDVLGAAGLTTGLIGKWHVGTADQHHPLNRGFDTFFGFLDGRRMSLPPGQEGVLELDVQPYEASQWPVSATGGVLQRGGSQVPQDPEQHLTDTFADDAVAYVHEHAGEPFFLYMALHAPHLPLQAGPEHLALVTDPPSDPDLWVYQATVAAMDRAVDRMLTALDEAGIADDTLVVFTSDNGCIDIGGFCSNAPLRGGKLTLMEGGVRVPFLVRWPGRLPAGIDVDTPVTSLDLMPTFAAATGATLPDKPLDGIDLVHALRHDTLTERPLFWRTFPVRAVQQDGMKLVHAFDVEVGEAYYWLYDLASDPSEQDDLFLRQPEAARTLLEALDGRAAGVYQPPAWEPRVGLVNYYGQDMQVWF